MDMYLTAAALIGCAILTRLIRKHLFPEYKERPVCYVRGSGWLEVLTPQDLKDNETKAALL